MPSTGVAPRRRDVGSVERATFDGRRQMSARDKCLEFHRDVRYAPATMEDKDITILAVLDAMQSMEGRINKRLDGVDSRLTGIDAKLDRMERNLTRQINGIDKRLDEIEIETLPKRVSRIEERLGIGSVAA